ncbi:MAG: HupE/UreJ family protein [Deltaproteobacteria bacterium]|nr:HupE/UreJ family protein [Deltaproteobacteria bacterium]
MAKRLLIHVLILLSAFVSVAGAHELRPAYLQIKQIDAEHYQMLWKTPARGPERRLALYVVFDQQAHLEGTLRSTFTGDAFLEYAIVTRPGGLDGSEIRIDGLSGTMTDALVRVERLDGTVQVVRLTPPNPSFRVTGTRSAGEVVKTYFLLGIEHILSGIDHLLFVLGLLLIVSSGRMLVKTITSFTIAHSITLAIATLGYAGAPGPPVEAAIALSILFLGPEIVRVWRGQTSLTIRHPWVVAFAFGLLHGFGFAGGLSTIGLPNNEIAMSLLFFNLGVESGQLLFVALIFAIRGSFRTLAFRWPRWAQLIPGFAVGTLGAFWTIERTLMMLRAI